MNDDIYSIYIRRAGAVRLIVPKGHALPSEFTDGEWYYMCDLASRQLSRAAWRHADSTGYWLGTHGQLQPSAQGPLRKAAATPKPEAPVAAAVA